MTHPQKPDYVIIAESVMQNADWKQALDTLTASLRSFFLFDNMALYLVENDQINLIEIVYARAMGRGKSAEADLDWGMEIASAVIHGEEIVIKTPDAITPRNERTLLPYFLGLPLRTPHGVIGVLVFTRFGGPAYTEKQISDARFLAAQFANMFERKQLYEQVAALQDARRQINLQEDFIATISHELRTPLGFIKGYSTTLLRPDTQWDEETRREFLTIIDEEADHLTSLISHMLESARLQSKTLAMNFQPVRIDSLLRDSIARVNARYKELQISSEVVALAPTQADNVRLMQVFENLFSNAVKYAPGSPVHVRISLHENYQRIEFIDHGPGISPEYLPHIFDKFYRVPGYGTSGSGLGLFICNQIIKAHQGIMSVQSEGGVGTTFIIDLPIQHPE
ncbi:MAG: GAF domain-containing sensor histidine kinase [Anaerolineales bacterium]|jgi:signal transduction histidine kinase|nr:GAF domain-containing sensor histidine kinase [Anaerolineales bacterium]